MVKDNNNDTLVKLLQSIGVCSRCILRFLGVKKYSAYISEEEIAKMISSYQVKEEKADESDVENQPPLKRLCAGPCSLCLGILGNECDAMVNRIGDFTLKSGFEFTDFQLQLSVPVAVDLREALVSLYVKDKLSDVEFDEKKIPSVKEVWKWVVADQLGSIMKVYHMNRSAFHLTVSYTYPDLASDCTKLLTACPGAFPNRGKKKKLKLSNPSVYNRTSVMKALTQLSSQLKSLYELPPSPPSVCCTYQISCVRSPIFLAGRYNKYSRELSQTPWIVEGERRMETSVQELITDVILKYISCDNIIFSASGREDVDVKMLGNGRPFVLEIINSRKTKLSQSEIKQIEDEINRSTGAISVCRLQIVPKSEVKRLKEGEEDKKKTYSALCCVRKALTPEDLRTLEGLTEIHLKQLTPIRVLHRRPHATRDRVIYKMSGEIIDSHFLRIHLETQAGTYVKEFVHSDFGRTVPNLGSLLGTEADIIELDVESIDLDWPPDRSSAVKIKKEIGV